MGIRWILGMAWRDSRSSRGRLALFSLGILFGVGALVAIRSFGDNLETAIEEESKALVGADLVIRARAEFPPEVEAWIETLGVRRAREVIFSSMAFFPETGASRLVQVRGLEKGFPFYGELETTPADARARLADGETLLMEESLMARFGLAVGDPVRIGTKTFELAGAIERVPGEMAAVGLLAPRVYVSHEAARATGLLGFGSVVRNKAYIRFPPETDVAEFLETIGPQLKTFRLSTETVESSREDLGQTLEGLQSFFQLVGLVALLLGSVGVASAVHVYVKRKIGTAAILRCLGAGAWQAFGIYLVQGMALGIVGAGAGSLFGVGLQTLFPYLLRNFLPVDVEVFVSWVSILEGFGIGFAVCLVFALLPLFGVRRVSPLRAIRRGENFAAERRRDPLRWLAYLAVAALVTGVAARQTGSLKAGLGFAGGIGVAFLTLTLLASGIVFLVRRFLPRRLPYVWRQGLANLYRPENRTVLLMLSLGLGTFLVLTLYLSRDLLLGQVAAMGEGERPTMAFFDVQDDQREEIAGILAERELPLLQDVPIVTMRLAAVKGRPVSEIVRDGTNETPDWVLRREYRSTYRNHLVSTERLVAGVWTPSVAGEAELFPVSVEEGIAEDLGIGVGDALVFDVQGVPVETVVGSIRKVDWMRVHPNFFVVFPDGILEPAPKFHVMVTRTETPEETAAVQGEVVERFPNVSAIDLSLILETLDSILSKATFVIRFLALLTVATGLMVLAAAVATSRYQRMRESVLLRVLGASRAQVERILLIEYASLGVLAGAAGSALALGAAWAMAAFVFERPFAPSAAPVVVAVAATGGVTVLVGLVSSRGILNQPPLESLRAEES